MISLHEKASTSPTEAELTIHGPDRFGDDVCVEEGNSLTVGSHSSCDLVLPDPQVSAMHCVLKFLNGILWIQDWRSRAGTLVDGTPIQEETELASGAAIQVGPYRLSVNLSGSVTTPLAASPSVASPSVASPSVAYASTEARTVSPDLVDPPTTPSEGTAPRSAALERENIPSTLEPPVPRPAPPAAGPLVSIEPDDALYDETLSLLQEEVERLQRQLDEQSQQIEQLRSREPSPGPADCLTDTARPSRLNSVSKRIQELTDELQRSDERIATLEEILFIAEEATLAEQEERRQIESWIGDVEVRFGQREAEMSAENEVLTNKLRTAIAERNQLESRLQNASTPAQTQAAVHETLEHVQSENAELAAELERHRLSTRTLEQTLEELQQQVDPDAFQRRVDEALREERLLVAQERAELARQRMALVRDTDTLPRTARSGSLESETKFKAIRQQLKEIHDEELEKKKERSIGARLSRLWKSSEKNVGSGR